MTKLVIQVPCYNEEETIGVTLRCLPNKLPGIDTIEWLIIDDGSTDRTIEEAVASGVDHVVRLPSHQGLARAFMAGLEACIKAGADIVVNTDADNQYSAEDIPKIIEPILSGEAGAPTVTASSGRRPLCRPLRGSPLATRQSMTSSAVL